MLDAPAHAGEPTPDTAPATRVATLPGMPALLVATLLGFAGFSVLLPTAPLWAVRGGADVGGAGLVNGVALLCTVLTQPVVPRLLRRLGWGRVLAVGLLLMGVPSLLHLTSDALAPTLALSAVRGAGFGVLTVTGSAAVAELVDAARRGRAVGLYGLAIALPQVVLLPLSPWLADRVGFAPVFVLAAAPVLAIPAALALGRHLDGRPSATASEEHARVDLRTVVLPLLPPMLVLTGITLAGGAVLSFAPQMLDEAALVTLALVVVTATSALARWRVGALADRYGARRFVAPLVVVGALGSLLIALSLDGPSVPLLVLGSAALGMAYGGLQNLTLVLSFAAVHRRHYGTTSAVWNVGFDLGTGVGSVLVGSLAAGLDFERALLVTAAITALTLPLALVRSRRPAG
ncbi:MFS transporter [Janibacter sp. UYMM211]|uniref:MFS transporter n=1 Tax=Janibacter sp. UYMM211 TaxID=3156342 RepID=UPI0033987DCE